MGVSPFRRRARVGTLAVGVVVLVVGALAVPDLVRRAELAARKDALAQIGMALRQYAKAHDARFPPKAAVAEAFHPDLDRLRPCLPPPPEADRLIAFMTDRERPVCYIGHLLLDQDAADFLFDQYATRGCAATRDNDFGKVEVGAVGFLPRLGIGVGRFLVRSIICCPSGGDRYDSPVPVLWELPEPNTQGEALVLFADGHVELSGYPGRFPLTEPFVRLVRERMGFEDAELPVSAFGAFPPRGSAIAEQVEAVVAIVQRNEDLISAGPRILECDIEPSVHVGGAAGYRARIEGLEIVLFSDPPDSGTTATREVPWQENTGVPADLGHDIGQAMGYRWFGKGSAGLLELLRRELAMTGGEELYPVFEEEAHWWRLRYARRTPALSNAGISRLLATPPTFAEYRSAYMQKRARDGNPVAEKIVDAEYICYGWPSEWIRPSRAIPTDIIETATEVIRESPDVDAQVLIALDRALMPGHDRKAHWPESVREDGRALLKHLPRESCIPFVRHLAANLGDDEQRTWCREILAELEGDG